jgi:hypothetical protein
MATARSSADPFLCGWAGRVNTGSAARVRRSRHRPTRAGQRYHPTTDDPVGAVLASLCSSSTCRHTDRGASLGPLRWVIPTGRCRPWLPFAPSRHADSSPMGDDGEPERDGTALMRDGPCRPQGSTSPKGWCCAWRTTRSSGSCAARPCAISRPCSRWHATASWRSNVSRRSGLTPVSPTVWKSASAAPPARVRGQPRRRILLHPPA